MEQPGLMGTEVWRSVENQKACSPASSGGRAEGEWRPSGQRAKPTSNSNRSEPERDPLEDSKVQFTIQAGKIRPGIKTRLRLGSGSQTSVWRIK